MTKAIIFDCFGVLATDGWLPFKRKYFGHDKALFDEAGNLNNESNAGRLSYESFISKVAHLAKVPEAVLQKSVRHNVPDEKLFAYIEELKPKYKIGMLSNASSDWLGRIFTKEQLGMFDATALSFEMGVVKPELKAYQIIAERLGVKPSECVFIDDQERHVVGAKAAGMKTIEYKSFDQMKAELEGILKSDEKVQA